jgi:amino acid permease
MSRAKYNKYKKILIIATVVLGVILIVFVILAQFYRVFFLCSYIAIGVYFLFFIFYQIYDTVIVQKTKTKQDKLNDNQEK